MPQPGCCPLCALEADSCLCPRLPVSRADIRRARVARLTRAELAQLDAELADTAAVLDAEAERLGVLERRGEVR